MFFKFYIGIVFVNNYVKKYNFFKIVREYFIWFDMFYYGGELMMVNKGVEGEYFVRIKGKKFFVDGYYFAIKFVFEFLGCFYYGCFKCILFDFKCFVNNKRNRDLFLEV